MWCQGGRKKGQKDSWGEILVGIGCHQESQGCNECNCVFDLKDEYALYAEYCSVGD